MTFVPLKRFNNGGAAAIENAPEPLIIGYSWTPSSPVSCPKTLTSIVRFATEESDTTPVSWKEESFVIDPSAGEEIVTTGEIVSIRIYKQEVCSLFPFVSLER